MSLSKPDGGTRPIAIGNMRRRLADKACTMKLKDTANRIFSPNQMRVGTPLGAEVAAHSCWRFVEHPQSDGKVVLKIDFRNPSNTI